MARANECTNIGRAIFLHAENYGTVSMTWVRGIKRRDTPITFRRKSRR